MVEYTGEQKLFALLSYLGLLVLIPLLLKKDDSYVFDHAKQGLALLIMSVIASVVFMIPFIGWFVLGPLAMLFVFVLSIIGIVKSLTGSTWTVPLMGNMARGWKF